MPELQPLNDDERDELVAYLDGELSETETESVEKRIRADPKFRAEVDALRQTYNLLDYLPRPEPSASFTNRTLSQVSGLRPKTTQLPTAAPRKNWGKGLGWAGALLAASVVGYFGVAWLPTGARPKAIDAPAELEQQLARDLRLLERLALYQYVDDIYFLNELDRPELFGDDPGF